MNYSSLDIASLAAERERLATTETSNQYWRLPESAGVTILRFLPPAKGMFGREKNPFSINKRSHKINGRYYDCLKEFVVGSKWPAGKCPVCDYIKPLWGQAEKSGGDEGQKLKDEYRSLKVVDNYYFNVIIRAGINGKTKEIEQNSGPYLLRVGDQLYNFIMRAILGDEEMQEKPLGDITHLVRGRDFKLVKTLRQSGRDNYPNYSDSKFLDPSPLGTQEQIDKWLPAMHDLLGLVKKEEYKELHRQVLIHMGREKDNTESFNPDEFAEKQPEPTVAMSPRFC